MPAPAREGWPWATISSFGSAASDRSLAKGRRQRQGSLTAREPGGSGARPASRGQRGPPRGHAVSCPEDGRRPPTAAHVACRTTANAKTPTVRPWSAGSEVARAGARRAAEDTHETRILHPSGRPARAGHRRAGRRPGRASGTTGRRTPRGPRGVAHAVTARGDAHRARRAQPQPGPRRQRGVAMDVQSRGLLRRPGGLPAARVLQRVVGRVVEVVGLGSREQWRQLRLVGRGRRRQPGPATVSVERREWLPRQRISERIARRRVRQWVRFADLGQSTTLPLP